MLLAGASVCPAWAVQYGLVQFWGNDIDMSCVLMTRLNVALYGLNGSHVRCLLELSSAELSASVSPDVAPALAEKVEEYRSAAAAGDRYLSNVVANEVRGLYKQGSLFSA
jgi:hypothetical protein